MHPIKIRASMSGRGMKGMKKGGFIGALLSGAIPLLASAIPGLIDKFVPRREGSGKKYGGLSAPYGGKMKKGKGKCGMGKCGMGSFTPGPLA